MLTILASVVILFVWSFPATESYVCLSVSSNDNDNQIEWCLLEGKDRICINAKSRDCCWNRWPNTSNILRSELTPEEKQSIIDLHNSVRVRFGLSSNITWDDTVANSAKQQTNLSSCEFRHSTQNVYGENLGYQSHKYPVEIVSKWYTDEIEPLRQEMTKNETRTSEPFFVAGHLTAMLNPNLKKIGCARKDCSRISTLDQDGNLVQQRYGGSIIQCHYEPGGHANWSDLQSMDNM